MPDSWFYIRDKKKQGPIGRAQLQQLALGGLLAPTDMVMQEGAGKWQAASEVPGLFPSKPAVAAGTLPRAIVRSQPTAQGIQPKPQPPSSPGVQKPMSAAPPIHNRLQPTAQGIQPRPPVAANHTPPAARTAPPAPSPSAPADQWFYVKDKKKLGPVTLVQLKQLVAGGQLRGSDMVLAAGTTKWQPAGAVPGMFAPPPAKPARPAPASSPNLGPAAAKPKPAGPASSPNLGPATSKPAGPASSPNLGPPAAPKAAGPASSANLGPAKPATPPAAAAPKPAPAPPPRPLPPPAPPKMEEEDDEEYEDDDELEDDEDEEDDSDDEGDEDDDEEYEDDEDEVDIHENLERASALQAAGDFPKAIAEYSTALRAAPGDPKPYNALAWIWATCPDDKIRDGKKAVEYAKQAVSLLPEGHTYYRVKFQETLAAAHAEAGNFAAASAAIDEAIIHASFDDQPRLCRRRGLYHNEQAFRDVPGADDPIVPEGDDENILLDPTPPKEGFFSKVSRSIGKLLNDRDPDDERAFHEAIAAHPDDDTPRLAYADWLLGFDDPQGEFIRLDIELDRMTGDDPRRDELDQRWSTLLEEHATHWLKGLADLGVHPTISGKLVPGMWYERGLITTVEIEKPDLLPAKATGLFTAAPALQTLRFRCQELDLAGLARLPQLAQIVTLDLSGVEMKVSGLRALLASPHLTRLTELDLNYNELGDEGITVLSTAPRIAQLTALHLRSTGFTPRGLDVLIRSPNLARLEHLDLGSNDLDSDSLRQLLGARHLAQLKSLSLATSRFGAEGARALASAAVLRNLEALRLSWCEIGPEGAKALAASPYLHQLTSLDLAGNAIKAEGAKAMAASRLLSHLEQLDLDSNELGPTGARALAASPFLAHLTELSLGRNEIGDEGVGSLTGSPHFAKLVKLSLSENGITTKGAQSLASARFLKSLRELTLFDNRLGLGGAIALAGSGQLQKLHALGVTDKAVSAAGKEKLLARFGEDVVSFQ